METTAMEGKAATHACSQCDTPNRSGARFCKACGASIAPPPECPKCKTEVPPDAKFCADCGAKLVGQRPAAPAPAAAAPARTVPDAAANAVRAEAAKLPPVVRKPSSSITSNLLFFVAILMALIVVIYVMNKGEPKSVSPFEGGPAPSAMNAPTEAAPPAAPPTAPPAAATAGGGVVRGTISIAESLKNEGDGTIFLIVRNKGMPNRGPPIAAKKLDASSFPVSFAVSAADVMMPGMTFTGPFDLYARLDRDGNAMTKEAGDLVNSAPHSGSKPGDENVAIVLDQRL